jgi:hypothetical protein
MPDTTASALRVREMDVIWRDTFIVEDASGSSAQRAPADFLEASRDRLLKLPVYVADRYARRHDTTDLMRVVERASRNVARIGYDSLTRFQFAPFDLANLQPTLSRLRCSPDALTPEDITDAGIEARKQHDWIEITPVLLLHRAGVGIMEYLASFRNDRGYTPDEAIERVRLGISPQLLALSGAWVQLVPEDSADWPIHTAVAVAPDRNLLVAGLRDISQIIAAYLSPHRRPSRPRALNDLGRRPVRPTGSTTVVLVETDPLSGIDLANFVSQHATTLRGIGAMDNYYTERAAWIVERELGDNLSVDTEAAVFLLGNSELILFNDQLKPVATATRERLGLRSQHLAVTYMYNHYQVLMEWTYLQDAILRAYINRLDALAATSRPRRAQMIATLQGALSDLIQYQENITAFATRVEFLERTRAYHKLDQLSERFERKQELLLNYFSEYHDYREARAAEFLNGLAAVITGASLANLLTTLLGITAEQTALYLTINLVCIALVLAILWLRQRFI